MNESHERTPSEEVVDSVRGTPLKWARVLALNEVYRSRCQGEDRLYKRMTTRQGAYLKGIIKNQGPNYAAAVVAATTSYVRSLSDLDVAAAVRQVNLDSGYQPAAGTYHGATYGQRRWPSSTACEDGGSSALGLSIQDVVAAVRQVNLDSGYQPAAGTYHGATYGQRRWPSSTACEDGDSSAFGPSIQETNQ